MNKEIFLFINQFAGKNHIVDLITILFAKGMPYFFILVEIYLYYFAKKKNEAIFAFYSMIFALFINWVISLFYFHNRPFMDNLGTLLIHHKADTSFPSDHTTFLFSLAFSFRLFKVRFWKLFLFLAFLGGIARVYVGVHYPFDILGGMIIAFISSLFIFYMRDKFLKINFFIIKIFK